MNGPFNYQTTFGHLVTGRVRQPNASTVSGFFQSWLLRSSWIRRPRAYRKPAGAAHSRKTNPGHSRLKSASHKIPDHLARVWAGPKSGKFARKSSAWLASQIRKRRRFIANRVFITKCFFIFGRQFRMKHQNLTSCNSSKFVLALLKYLTWHSMESDYFSLTELDPYLI